MDANQSNAAEPESERELTIRRVFAVPARILFEAHSKPEHLISWFGPSGYPLSLCEMEFRTGGRYRFALRGPDGALMTPFSGEYLEIVRDRKISWTNTLELPGAETMVVTVTFDEEDGKTTLTLHTLFASAAQKREHLGRGYERGVSSALRQLADLAARLEAA